MKLTIIGLGYVGLPLAIELSKNYSTFAYDIDRNRIEALKLGKDINNQFRKKDFIDLKNLNFTSKKEDLTNSDIFFITVPSPINKNKSPNLSLIEKASYMISKIIKKNDIVVLESTVYPGVTRKIVGKIIEKNSGLKFLKDFNLAYSPERINPGDNKKNIKNIRKIIGASNKQTLNKVSKIYNSFLEEKIFKTESIEIAEAAKVIENTQRDVNIALINEFNKIFNSMSLDTNSILNAASTKWNFLNFKPGLVGGHCIGVDPYYLAFISRKFGTEPKMILSGREVNETVPKLILKKCLSKLNKNKNLRVLFLGLTFKENCPDFRNSKAFDLLNLLKKYSKKIDIYDPFLNNLKKKYSQDFKVLKNIPNKRNFYDLVMIIVPHRKFVKININKYLSLIKEDGFIYDFKNILNNHKSIIKV